jgi:hypothetical protein
MNARSTWGQLPPHFFGDLPAAGASLNGGERREVARLVKLPMS